MAAAPAWWEMGLLNLSDWTAKWIAWKDQLEEDRAGISWISSGPTDPAPALPRPASTFRYQFNTTAPRDVAIFVVATFGFQIRVNGRLVAAKRDWNTFDRQDITGDVVDGGNIVEIAIPAQPIGRGPIPPAHKLAALIKIVDTDGKIERHATGEMCIRDRRSAGARVGSQRVDTKAVRIDAALLPRRCARRTRLERQGSGGQRV